MLIKSGSVFGRAAYQSSVTRAVGFGIIAAVSKATAVISTAVMGRARDYRSRPVIGRAVIRRAVSKNTRYSNSYTQ